MLITLPGFHTTAPSAAVSGIVDLDVERCRTVSSGSAQKMVLKGLHKLELALSRLNSMKRHDIAAELEQLILAVWRG
jgi:hypothetical protein